MRTAVLTLLLLLLISAAYAGDGDAQAEVPRPELSSLALGAANAVAAALLTEQPEAVGDLLGPCYVWQQPGVALVIHGVWSADGEQPELWLTSERLEQFLAAQRNLGTDAPFVYPGEKGKDVDSFYIEPMVCLLDCWHADYRLMHHLGDYHSWIELNEGMEFIWPEDEALTADFAVVFIDSSGPLEFYFQLDEDGGLRLVHLICYYFFSA